MRSGEIEDFVQARTRYVRVRGTTGTDIYIYIYIYIYIPGIYLYLQVVCCTLIAPIFYPGLRITPLRFCLLQTVLLRGVIVNRIYGTH